MLWAAAVKLGLEEVLGMSVPSTAPTSVVQSLTDTARAFVSQLEQAGDIQCLENLIAAFRKRTSKSGIRLLPSSPARVLVNDVCQSALHLVGNNFFLVQETYSKMSYITDANMQLLNKVGFQDG